MATDGIKTDAELRSHIHARRISLHAQAAASVHDASRRLSTPSLPSSTDGRAPASEMDGDSVERPEDICELSSDEWDLEEAVSSPLPTNACAAAGETAPASYPQRTSSEELMDRLLNDAAPLSDFEGDAAGIWAAPHGYSV